MSSFSRSTPARTRRSASCQQGLLVDEVAADHAVLRVLPVPDERPDPVDHPLGLVGLPLPVRQGPQALQHLLLLRPRLLPPLLEAPRAGARLEVPDVAEDHAARAWPGVRSTAAG